MTGVILNDRDTIEKFVRISCLFFSFFLLFFVTHYTIISRNRSYDRDPPIRDALLIVFGLSSNYPFIQRSLMTRY